MDYLWVGIGGLVGANARFAVGRLIGDRFGTTFPFGTLVVNVSGALAIGLVLSVLVARVEDPAWRLLVVTGFLGGYTTFSAYSFEAVTLLLAGRGGQALLYVLGSNLLGVVGCWVGVLLGRAIVR